MADVDADQVWIFFVAIASLATFYLIIFLFIPSLAGDRLVLRLSAARDDIDALWERPLNQVERDAVEELDSLVLKLLTHGAPPAALLGVGLFALRRARKSGTDPAPEREVWQRLHGDPACRHRTDIDVAERTVMREAMRATLLGGPFWFVLWPFWLMARHTLRGDGPLIIESPGEVSVEKTLIEAVEINRSGILVPA